MTIFPRVSETLIYLTAAADVTHRKESMKRQRGMAHVLVYLMAQDHMGK